MHTCCITYQGEDDGPEGRPPSYLQQAVRAVVSHVAASPLSVIATLLPLVGIQAPSRTYPRYSERERNAASMSFGLACTARDIFLSYTIVTSIQCMYYVNPLPTFATVAYKESGGRSSEGMGWSLACVVQLDCAWDTAQWHGWHGWVPGWAVRSRYIVL